MQPDDLLKTRIRVIGGEKPKYESQSVLYVMSRDVRISDNHALLAAQKHALARQLPLLVVFVLYDKPVPNRAREHIEFLIQGVREVGASLDTLGIAFTLQTGETTDVVTQLSRQYQADAIYMDFSPLRHARQQREQLADRAPCKVYEVDTHNVVPVWIVSDKQEIGARTIRTKIHKQLETYLHKVPDVETHPHLMKSPVSTSLGKIDEIIRLYPENHTNVERFVSGETGAQDALRQFMNKRFTRLGSDRSNPTIDAQTELSPYLHFGMISSLRVILEVMSVLADHNLRPSALMQHRMPRPSDDKPPLLLSADVLIEELIVRKELSDNYCLHNNDYDALVGAPEWAQRTLTKHASDPREFVYSYDQLESAETHDTAWNAAQRELTSTGKMHNYMRMYWAKKILEWTESPEQALEYALRLNDFYSLDGGDPNGYVGVLWSVAGLHDRPWGERPVYGVVRSMVYTGLKRKFDIQAYELAHSGQITLQT